MYEAPKKDSRYQQYRELGGIINEEDYENALLRAKNPVALDTDPVRKLELVAAVKTIAELAGIELHNTKENLDRRVILFGVLRTDARPKETKYHHSQMGDPKLFAEVLRMLGDTDALDKLIDAYHKVETYCPVCLNKKVAYGEKCR